MYISYGLWYSYGIYKRFKRNNIIKGEKMKIIGKLVVHPETGVLGYFNESDEFIRVVDREEE